MSGYTPSTDLNFAGAYTPPAGGAVDLAMPASGVVTTRGAIHLAYPKPKMAVTADVARPPNRDAHIVAVKVAPVLRVRAHYDLLVTRPFGPEARVRHQVAHPDRVETRSEYQVGAHAPIELSSNWDVAQRFALAAVSGRWQDGVRLKVSDRLRHQIAHPQPGTPVGGVFRDLVPYKPASRMRWEKAKLASLFSTASRYQRGAPVKRTSTEPWQQAKRLQRDVGQVSKIGMPFFSTPDRVRWQTGRKPPVGKEGDSKPPVTPPYQGTGSLAFVCPWLHYAGDDVLLKFGKYPCKEVEPPDQGTVVVPVKRVYIVINNVQLRRVDGNVFIPTFSLSMSIDADSWTWGFNATIPRDLEDAVQASSDGTPPELAVTINGSEYRMVAERPIRDREFNRAIVRVSGRGKAAMLEAPVAPVMSFNNASAQRTAQQLMNDALTLNGASIGWTIDWGITDWLVPAGAWAHRGTYISALTTIAGAAGAYIQPDPVLQKLRVLARYPSAPWNWGTVTPDFELPSDVTTREGIEWVQRPRYNRVFVRGEGQGVQGQVTRTGTAGDIIAPMVTDALITHADAARQRGLSVLSDTGTQAHISLRLPVLAETGVIQPGKFVRYIDGGVTRIGIVRSTAVDASFPEVWQTLGVESHVA